MNIDLFEDKDAWKKLDTKSLMKIIPNYFEFTGDIEHSAYLNWRFDSINNTENQFYEMGKAYLETAIQLVDICLKDNIDNKADIWIFPILFNVVHGIEIYLKGFNSQIRICLFNPQKPLIFQGFTPVFHSNLICLPLFLPLRAETRAIFYSPPTTLSSSLAEVRFASLVE